MNFRDIWIYLLVPSIIFKWCKMADLDMNSSDNEAEFAGFTNEDIENTNDSYVSDSDPDLDITISSVHSSDITDFGKSDGDSGNDNDNAVVPDEWTCDFGRLKVNLLFRKVALFYLMTLILLDGVPLII